MYEQPDKILGLDLEILVSVAQGSEVEELGVGDAPFGVEGILGEKVEVEGGVRGFEEGGSYLRVKGNVNGEKDVHKFDRGVRDCKD